MIKRLRNILQPQGYRLQRFQPQHRCLKSSSGLLTILSLIGVYRLAFTFNLFGRKYQPILYNKTVSDRLKKTAFNSFISGRGIIQLAGHNLPGKKKISAILTEIWPVRHKKCAIWLVVKIIVAPDLCYINSRIIKLFISIRLWDFKDKITLIKVADVFYLQLLINMFCGIEAAIDFIVIVSNVSQSVSITFANSLKSVCPK
jgi:hypothetical protein